MLELVKGLSFFSSIATALAGAVAVTGARKNEVSELVFQHYMLVAQVMIVLAVVSGLVFAGTLLLDFVLDAFKAPTPHFYRSRVYNPRR